MTGEIKVNYQELFDRLSRELCVQWARATWDFNLPKGEVPDDIVEIGAKAFTDSFGTGESRSLAQLAAMLAMENVLPSSAKKRP